MGTGLRPPWNAQEPVESWIRKRDNQWDQSMQPERLPAGADTRGEVTWLLAEVKRGRRDALDQVMPLVYRELRRIARSQMRGKRISHTLQPTALLHEAFFRLVDQRRAAWQNRTVLCRGSSPDTPSVGGFYAPAPRGQARYRGHANRGDFFRRLRRGEPRRSWR